MWEKGVEWRWACYFFFQPHLEREIKISGNTRRGNIINIDTEKNMKIMSELCCASFMMRRTCFCGGAHLTNQGSRSNKFNLTSGRPCVSVVHFFWHSHTVFRLALPDSRSPHASDTNRNSLLADIKKRLLQSKPAQCREGLCKVMAPIFYRR